MPTPLIAPPPEPLKKRTVNVRLEEEIFENLKRYIAYAGRGDFSHVVNNGMRYLFLKDTGFQSWLAEHPAAITEASKKKRHTKPLQQSKAATHRDVPTEAPSLWLPLSRFQWLEGLMPMLFPRPICGLRCNQFRCFAAAVGGVRKNRTLTRSPHVGFTHANIRSRLSTRCGSLRCRLRRSRSFTRVYARQPSRNKMPWEFSL